MIDFIRNLLFWGIFGFFSVLFYPILEWWGLLAGLAVAILSYVTISTLIKCAFPFPLTVRINQDSDEITLRNNLNKAIRCTLYFVGDPDSDSHFLIPSYSHYTFSVDRLKHKKIILRAQGAVGEISIRQGTDEKTLYTDWSLTYTKLD